MVHECAQLLYVISQMLSASHIFFQDYLMCSDDVVSVWG